MAKESTLQIRMDSDLREEVESLYRAMGISFPEAVRMFAIQSVQEQAMPFAFKPAVTVKKKDPLQAYKEFQRYRSTLPDDFNYREELAAARDERYQA